ncbi:hypothetical protein [Beggiatoa leptomitoformis]|uniref:Uncharacterized protein n=1 Tax=Beggiatoa leptomitoformis TaxID=288004 RepID=A0A2N9YGT1_9GAMM|nr:hypothetical protein [Beggiatoa leptomitoformis]ALG68273.1 hypothetical protein AL038_11835 [Beggiatoa leptomitoformis]AUI69416.1 hypothetical protein BLE401_12435 [Beggiatoa leptomitoformis]
MIQTKRNKPLLSLSELAQRAGKPHITMRAVLKVEGFLHSCRDESGKPREIVTDKGRQFGMLVNGEVFWTPQVIERLH